MKRMVVGLIAHVDAGKTTLAESLLFEAGSIRRAGRVDHKDAFLDFDPIERERGITVFSKQARLESDGAEIILLDAPGHVDFSCEAERTLSVLDAAVLVVAANEGIGGHTLTLWRLLERYGVPCIFFINKCDLATADVGRLVEEIRSRLSDGAFGYAERGDADVLEAVAMSSEEALDEFLETGTLSHETLRSLVLARKAFPILRGSALRSEGMRELLELLGDLGEEADTEGELGARVFKVSHEKGERLVWLRVTSGTLHAKEEVEGHGIKGSWRQKADQLRLYNGSRMRVVTSAEASDIVVACGLADAQVGDGIGIEPAGTSPLLAPVLEFAVTSESCDAHGIYEALSTLTDEDPLLGAYVVTDTGEVRVRCMGLVQQEIVHEQLMSRFGIDASFGEGTVLMKETIAKPVEGVGHFEPLRHYAEVHLLLEPTGPGTGMSYESRCSTDDLELRWQRLILTHAAEREHKGVLTGAPLTDCRIVLIAGRAHPKHTEGGDFRQATYRAIRQGLMRAESMLLEPWYSFVLEVPKDRAGRALSDLSRMGARFEVDSTDAETCRIVGAAPVKQIQGYASVVAAYTQGCGSIFLEPLDFEEVEDAEALIEEAAYEPEADLEHTPDSVFCSHGAGYTVKWYDVEEHAHIKL